MARFKSVQRTFLFRSYLAFWGNLLNNYDGECRDGDFFAAVLNCFDRRMGGKLLLDAFAEEELAKLGAFQMAHGRFELCVPLNELFRLTWNDESGRARSRIVLNAIREYLVNLCSVEGSDDLERRFEELKRMLKLSDLEGSIVVLAYLCGETGFAWPCRVTAHERPLYYAMALDRSYDEVCEVLSEKGRLHKLGVLDDRYNFNRQGFGNFINGSASEPIERRFYRSCDLSDPLPWSFYGELATGDGAMLKRMLSVSKGKCNILLYGAPGTGKTSFAQAIAKEVNRRSFEVRQDDGEELRLADRMVCVQIANEQLAPEDSLLIVDEADEFFSGGTGAFGPLAGWGSGRKGKCEVNMLLDDMRIPVIWISNVPAEEMDESVRRRFDYSVCFEGLNETQRTRIWRNQVKRLGLGEQIAESKLAGYAARYETNAGGVAIVLENLKRMRPASDEVDDLICKLMASHCELMGVRSATGMLPAKDYSLDGLNIKGKVGLDKIVCAARNFLSADFNAASVDRPRLNILLFGPPGTGKTEFVKYLGKVLERKVLVRKASDLLDMYVGNTEKQIAAVFHRAEAEHAILFFDEIDGLVQDREGAKRGWEVTQVNELLQQMENFDGVMIAATNFSKNLDAAIMRRFTFKLEFDYLDDNGKKLFFERTFKSELRPEEFAELKRLSNLAPGDFRTVRQKQFYLGEELTNLDRIAALQEECAVKKDGNRFAKIGFAA